ncbi:MAG: DUF1456 family protein [Desulfobacterales bacterium]|nr:DUF1456 family protein [Desulfobacterales bacterium]
MMTNNDILRRIRYIFSLSDEKVISIFGEGGKTVTRAEISDWLKRDEDPDFKACSDELLATFLNGFIIEKRGRREGPQPVAERKLTHNIVFWKLKIALNLKADDVIDTLGLANFKISRHELSAFFRKPGHKHYRPCKDQILRNFLQGLQKREAD